MSVSELWSWCCHQVVLWSHREVCEYECISTPLHWLPRLLNLVVNLRFALQVSLCGTPTQPLHPPRAWHPIVGSCVSSTVHRCASASSWDRGALLNCTCTVKSGQPGPRALPSRCHLCSTPSFLTMSCTSLYVPSLDLCLRMVDGVTGLRHRT